MAVSAERIGGWLRDARKAHGEFSAEQAAVRVGTTGRTMGTWERGEVAPPADTFFALAILYNADPGDLLPRPRARPPTEAELREQRKLEREVARRERENAKKEARARGRDRTA